MSENLEDHVSCPICMQIFNDPKSLSCGHSVCDNCIHGLRDGPMPSIRCPLCRVETRSGFGHTLPTNVSLKNIVELFRSSGRLSQNSQLRNDTAISCSTSGCDKSAGDNTPWSQGDFWLCSDCSDAIFCSTCLVKSHAKHSTISYQEHLIPLVEQLRSKHEAFQTNLSQLEGLSRRREDAVATMKILDDQMKRVMRMLNVKWSSLRDRQTAVCNMLSSGVIRLNDEGRKLNDDFACLAANLENGRVKEGCTLLQRDISDLETRIDLENGAGLSNELGQLHSTVKGIEEGVALLLEFWDSISAVDVFMSTSAERLAEMSGTRTRGDSMLPTTDSAGGGAHGGVAGEQEPGGAAARPREPAQNPLCPSCDNSTNESPAAARRRRMEEEVQQMLNEGAAPRVRGVMFGSWADPVDSDHAAESRHHGPGGAGRGRNVYRPFHHRQTAPGYGFGSSAHYENGFPSGESAVRRSGRGGASRPQQQQQRREERESLFTDDEEDVEGAGPDRSAAATSVYGNANRRWMPARMGGLPRRRRKSRNRRDSSRGSGARSRREGASPEVDAFTRHFIDMNEFDADAYHFEVTREPPPYFEANSAPYVTAQLGVRRAVPWRRQTVRRPHTRDLTAVENRLRRIGREVEGIESEMVRNPSNSSDHSNAGGLASRFGLRTVRQDSPIVLPSSQVTPHLPSQTGESRRSSGSESSSEDSGDESSTDSDQQPDQDGVVGGTMPVDVDEVNEGGNVSEDGDSWVLHRDPDSRDDDGEDSDEPDSLAGATGGGFDTANEEEANNTTAMTGCGLSTARSEVDCLGVSMALSDNERAVSGDSAQPSPAAGVHGRAASQEFESSPDGSSPGTASVRNYAQLLVGHGFHGVDSDLTPIDAPEEANTESRARNQRDSAPEPRVKAKAGGIGRGYGQRR